MKLVDVNDPANAPPEEEVELTVVEKLFNTVKINEVDQIVEGAYVLILRHDDGALTVGNSGISHAETNLLLDMAKKAVLHHCITFNNPEES